MIRMMSVSIAAAEVAGHRAERDADERREDDDAEADAQRDARAPDDAREHVAPEVVEAERDARATALRAAGRVLRIRIERRQQRRRERDTINATSAAPEVKAKLREAFHGAECGASW